jgi:uncharacterized protein (DUF1499 family)
MKMAGLLVGVLLAMAALLLVAGRLGVFAGKPPQDLGVRDGRLKPPSTTPNSVSSQTGGYTGHPQRNGADIAPLGYTGDAKAALRRLATLLETTPGCVLVARESAYLYAQCSTRWLKFTDDVEFFLDEASGVIQVRSASRLGSKDFGVNRSRVEALRARLAQGG